MSSSQNDKKSPDAEMAEASSQAPEPTPFDDAPACVAGFLSFRDKMARRRAKKKMAHADAELQSSSVLVVAPTHELEVQVLQGMGAQVEAGVPFVPDALVQPSGSSTTPILIESNKKATELMLPPPARKKIVLALRAPTATPVVQPKGRKRKCVTGNDRESSQQEGLNLASGLRGNVRSSLYLFTLRTRYPVLSCFAPHLLIVFPHLAVCVADLWDDQQMWFRGQSSCERFDRDAGQTV